jgi:competence protein ComEC
MFKFSRIKIYFLIFLLLANVMIFYAVISENRNGILQVSFLNIGQGDAALIESPTGNTFLIDGGPDKSILNALGRVLPFYDKTINAVLATHPDSDHVGGIPEVMKNYFVGEFVYTGATSSSGVFKELENEVSEKNIKINIARAGEIFDLGGGAFLKILYPDKTPQGTDTNEYSIVAELYYGDSTFMFTGDAPTDVLNGLAEKDGKELKSDVLKVAHHGSKNSLSPAFLSAVDPEYSIISAGKNNKYGFPNKEILDYLNGIKSQILATFDLGDIIFTSDGQTLEKK